MLLLAARNIVWQPPITTATANAANSQFALPRRITAHPYARPVDIMIQPLRRTLWDAASQNPPTNAPMAPTDWIAPKLDELAFNTSVTNTGRSVM